MILLQYILSFLLILCEVHIIHPNPTHLSTPPNLLSIPATSPPKENKQTNKHLAGEAVVCHTVDPFAQTALLADAHRSGALDWFEVSASATLSALGPLSYPPVVA